MNLKEKHYTIYMSNVKLNIQKTASYNGIQFVIHTKLWFWTSNNISLKDRTDKQVVLISD